MFFHEYTATLQDVSDFDEQFFRMRCYDEELPEGVAVVEGRLRYRSAGDESYTIQSYRFDRYYWSTDQAQRWLATKGIAAEVRIAKSFWSDVL